MATTIYLWRRLPTAVALTALPAAIALATARLRVAARLLLLLALTVFVFVPIVTGLARLTLTTLLTLLLHGAHISS